MYKIDTILVFAGNINQFEHWVKENFPNMGVPKNVVYANSYDKTLGYNNVIIVKTGTWYEHKWAEDAIRRLENMNIHKAVSENGGKTT